jgi:hypothetical protein
MLQIIACVIWSRPSTPNNASGFSSAMPNGPCSSSPSDSQPERANAGSTRVYIQTANPAANPASAPRRVPPFQKMPPSAAGANWATAANEMSPIETSA